MTRFFEPIPVATQRHIKENRIRYLEQLIEQKRMANNTEYHVKALPIEDIDFMTPLQHWNGLKELNPLLSYIIKRIYQPEPRENCVMMINGEQGSGKSFTAMELGYLTDDSFNVDSICFSLKEFKDCIEQGKKSIILDDLESFAHSRESMTKLNRWLSKTFDMLRFKRNFIIMTAPAFESVEKTLRGRTQIQAVTQAINSYNRTTIIKAFFLQVNTQTGETYRHSPIGFNKEKRMFYKVKSIPVGEPPTPLIKAYEEKKERAFLKIMGTLDRIESGTDKKSKSKGKPKYKRITDDYVSGLTIKEIANKYGNTENTVRKFLDYSRDNGYIEKAFKRKEGLSNPDT